MNVESILFNSSVPLQLRFYKCLHKMGLLTDLKVDHDHKGLGYLPQSRGCIANAIEIHLHTIIILWSKKRHFKGKPIALKVLLHLNKETYSKSKSRHSKETLFILVSQEALELKIIKVFIVWANWCGIFISNHIWFWENWQAHFSWEQ